MMKTKAKMATPAVLQALKLLFREFADYDPGLGPRPGVFLTAKVGPAGAELAEAWDVVESWLYPRYQRGQHVGRNQHT